MIGPGAPFSRFLREVRILEFHPNICADGNPTSRAKDAREMGHPAFVVPGYATIHSRTRRTTDAGASTSNSTAPSLYFRE